MLARRPLAKSCKRFKTIGLFLRKVKLKFETIKAELMSRQTLQDIYERLFRRFGPQHWWPGETPFEIIVGAILTQNTNWGNVEKAIGNLKSNDLLTPEKLHRLEPAELAEYLFARRAITISRPGG